MRNLQFVALAATVAVAATVTVAVGLLTGQTLMPATAPTTNKLAAQAPQEKENQSAAGTKPQRPWPFATGNSYKGSNTGGAFGLVSKDGFGKSRQSTDGNHRWAYGTGNTAKGAEGIGGAFGPISKDGFGTTHPTSTGAKTRSWAFGTGNTAKGADGMGGAFGPISKNGFGPKTAPRHAPAKPTTDFSQEAADISALAAELADSLQIDFETPQDKAKFVAWVALMYYAE